jgi:hypothetical protein
MYHSKRPRKQKIVWDSDFVACIATDDQLNANNASTLTGMDKGEDDETDLIKAAQAQAMHQLHEIMTPQVEFHENLQVKKVVPKKKKSIKPVECKLIIA